jgi:hypothetical protein
MLLVTPLASAQQLTRTSQPSLGKRLEQRELERTLNKPSRREYNGLLRQWGPLSIATKVAYVACTELDIASTTRNNGFEQNRFFQDANGKLNAGRNRKFSYGILGVFTLVEALSKGAAPTMVVMTGVVGGGRCVMAGVNRF